jgi:hypothetical protein
MVVFVPHFLHGLLHSFQAAHFFCEQFLVVEFHQFSRRCVAHLP